jgi:hypothetical protein
MGLHPEISPREILQQRRRDAKRRGPFAEAALAAFREAQTARRSGVSREDVAKGMALVLREHWPRRPGGRTEPWHYLCETCRDTGLRPVRVVEEIYGGEERERLTPCTCAKGQAWREAHRPKAPTRQSVSADVAEGW